MLVKYSLSLGEADRLGGGARPPAARVRPVSIAVVDDAGVTLAFARMDGARGHTVDLALQKARTSAIVGVPSALLTRAGAAGGGAGGVPIMRDGQCVGAIGVSGATEEQDVAVAEEAVAACGVGDGS